jgi:glycosyltransferase involved in cell wall biosynthesis
MNFNHKISIIVPIYKVEQYIHKCIESIIHQTYANLEIILVDDGSPDNCGEICDEYAQKDFRIKVIHKENGGLSDARNVAIDMAKGEYITFIDSDDFVTEDYIETLIDLVENYNVEISISQVQFCREDKDMIMHQKAIKAVVVNNLIGIERLLYQRGFETFACGKLYKKSLFDEIRYPKGMIFEDILVTYQLIGKAKSIAITNKKTYYYLQRKDSILGDGYYNKKMDILQIFEMMHKDFIENYPQLLLALKCRMISNLFSVLLLMPKGHQHEILFWNRIKLYRWEVLFDKKGRLKTRIACLISYCGLNWVRYFFSFINKRSFK